MKTFDETSAYARDICDDVKRTATGAINLRRLKLKAIGKDSEIEALFTKLGKLSYQKMKAEGSVPDEVKNTVAKLEEKIAELEEIKDEIALSAGGVVCNECGALNVDGTVNCSKCGAEI